MPELTFRDGMVIVGSLLILAVIVDAWRRMRQQQRSRVRVKLAADLPEGDPVDELALYRELPNGGARVVRRDEFLNDEMGKEAAASTAGAARDVATAAPAAPGKPRAGGDVKKPAAPAREVGGAAASVAPTKAVPVPAAAGPVPAAAPDAPASDSADSQSAVLEGMRARKEEPANLDWLEDLPPHTAADDETPGELPRQDDTEVIILHVMARDDRGFAGKDILEILLACDLRFGDMSFFHRHEQQAGRGPIQFSVANMLQPGVFDIDNMDTMRTRGLVFFLTLPGPEDMSQAYDYMLETARTVARNLGGELLDESRSVLTQQAVEHARQQIRELERRLRSRA